MMYREGYAEMSANILFARNVKLQAADPNTSVLFSDFERVFKDVQYCFMRLKSGPKNAFERKMIDNFEKQIRELLEY